ncbi:MAG TPA: TIGR03067 domain-containing protein [Gemmataceae bacterium]|nr:TIGR03067 domain-containing protein [Gemmataceae bacterium]
MRTLFSVLAVGLLIAAQGRPDDKKGEGKPQGTYTFVKHNADGKPTPEDELKGMTITFEGDKWVIKKGDEVISAGTHKLDPSKKPAEVDTKVTEGKNKGQTELGIYEMTGDDLKGCFAKEGSPRPKEFKTGTGLVYVELKKKK